IAEFAVVIATARPEEAVAATLKVEPNVAFNGACSVTVIVWLAICAFVLLCACAAALKLPSPAWLYETVQVPELAFMVMFAEPVPPPEQEPDVVIATPRPEEAVAATLKVVL